MKTATSSSLLLSAQIQGWIVVLLGFIGFIAWAATYPIDQGVPGSGFLISEAERIQVVAPSTGLVTMIAKRAGDRVQEGDVLLEFNSKPQQSNERSVQEAMRGIEVSNLSLGSALTARNAQVAAVQAQYDSSVKLVESGFASANALSTMQTQLSLAQSEALELKARIEQNDYRLRELKERQASLRHEMALLKIHAPASGTIMNMTLKSAGVSITAGSQIMEIVPHGERLLIDARIPVVYATRAHAGMTVDVMFPTLPGGTTARIKGKLEYLSADRLTDTRTNQIYFEGRVSLDEQTAVDQLSLRAGLPATVLLNTGPRTLMSYITRPLTERMTKGLQ